MLVEWRYWERGSNMGTLGVNFSRVMGKWRHD